MPKSRQRYLLNVLAINLFRRIAEAVIGCDQLKVQVCGVHTHVNFYLLLHALVSTADKKEKVDLIFTLELGDKICYIHVRT